MITSPNAYFTAEEAKLLDAQPVYRFTIFPIRNLTGLEGDGDGVFTDCSASNGRVTVDDGVSTASWVSPVEAVFSESFPADVTVSWTSNPAMFTEAAYYRTASTEAGVALEGWVAMAIDDDLSLSQYYQFKFEWTGFRCYALPAEDAGDPTAAYAVFDAEDPTMASWVSYAIPGTVAIAYIEDLTVFGEYVFANTDVKEPGTISLTSRPDFSEIAASEHTLELFNDEGIYDPEDDNFFLANESYWEGKYIRVEMGYRRAGSKIEDYPDSPRYEGVILGWEVYPEEVGEDVSVANVPYVSIYSNDLINRFLVQTVTNPLENGEPNPMVYGSGIREARKISSQNPFTAIKEAMFEDGTTSEVDAEETGTGGTLTVSSTYPIRGDYSLRASVAATASSKALVRLHLSTPSSSFYASAWFRVLDSPSSPSPAGGGPALICGVYDAAESDLVYLWPGADKKLYALIGGTSYETDVYLDSYPGQARISIAILVGNPGAVRIWINDDEVINKSDSFDTSAFSPYGAWFGVKTGTVAETWEIQVDNLEISDTWHPCIYQVAGFPFESINKMITDGRTIIKTTNTSVTGYIGPRPNDYVGYIGGVQTETSNYYSYPEIGCVTWDDWANGDPEGTIFLDITKDDTQHPVDVISAMLTAWGHGDKIDTTRFATAKAATPDLDIPILYYFDQETSRAEAITEITRRFLLNFFLDCGQARITAWSGYRSLYFPTCGYAWVGYDCCGGSEAELDLVFSSIKRRPHKFSLTDLVPKVTVKAGWYDRNPDMYYQAVNDDLLDILGDVGVDIDCTWGQPVSYQDMDVAKVIADALLLRLQSRWQKPEVSGWLDLARLEIGDYCTFEDHNYWEFYEVSEIGINLGYSSGLPGVDLKLIRYPGVEYGT